MQACCQKNNLCKEKHCIFSLRSIKLDNNHLSQHACIHVMASLFLAKLLNPEEIISVIQSSKHVSNPTLAQSSHHYSDNMRTFFHKLKALELKENFIRRQVFSVR
jgi:hypothetical protein